MIALRSLVGAVAFQRRSLETLASRRSLPFGAVCLLVGFTAYVGVRTAVYGGLMPDDPAEGGWWSPGFF
ncbi:MAG: hypothetical protein FJW35_11260, partial [Acidobacteria bacterium]|nr:hypothetical protein [Acidobacteriota bacterium]